MLSSENRLQKSTVAGVFPSDPGPLFDHMPHPPTDRLGQPQQLADLLLYRLYRLQATAGARVVRLCESGYGLTRREWRILSFLSTKEGALSSELAEHAMLDRARTSRAITRLVEKNLVRRQPRPSDRREVHVFLTDEGRRIAAELFEQVAAINRDILAPLDASERLALDSMLGRLQAGADGDGQVSALPSVTSRALEWSGPRIDPELHMEIAHHEIQIQIQPHATPRE
jgi:DNA-binding MarR family transcriptional regulator